MAFQQKDITGTMKEALARIKDLIQDEKVTIEEKRSGGWKYGGRELQTEIESLSMAMSSEYKVSSRLFTCLVLIWLGARVQCLPFRQRCEYPEPYQTAAHDPDKWNAKTQVR